MRRLAGESARLVPRLESPGYLVADRIKADKLAEKPLIGSFTEDPLIADLA